MNPFAESVLKELQRAIVGQQHYIARLQSEAQVKPTPDTEHQANLKEASQALTALIESYVTMTCNPEIPNV